MSFNITPVASGYQEIHPYSAMNIDSVKINTSLIMMKECIVLLVLSTTLESENGLLVPELQSIENCQFCQKSPE